MPRTGRGNNRSDLNTAVPAEGREFGAKAADEQAMDQMPLQPQGPLPGELGGLAGPTIRPTEPVTAGVDIGEGPGMDSRMFAPVPGMGFQTPLERVAEMTQNPRLKAMVRSRRV